jgi:hypothetical protein
MGLLKDFFDEKMAKIDFTPRIYLQYKAITWQLQEL